MAQEQSNSALTGSPAPTFGDTIQAEHYRDISIEQMRKDLLAGVSPDDIVEPAAQDTITAEYLDVWLNGLSGVKSTGKTATSPPGKVVKRRASERDRRSPKKVDFMRYQYERDFTEAMRLAGGGKVGEEEEEMEVLDFAALGIDMEAE